MIDRQTIEKIMNTAQIVEVVSDFVTLRKRGVNYVGLCPFHSEKTPSFTVSPARGMCKCFSCGKGGTAVNFIMEHEQLSYSDALRYLARKYHIDVQERELTNEEKVAQGMRESMFIANEFARNYFVDTLKNHAEGRTVGMAYFRERGFRDDTILKFQLGYARNDSTAFAKDALCKGYNPDILAATGLCIKRETGELRDRFWGRVIFPVHTLSGKVVAFGGRVLKTDAKTAKYVNSPESEIYHKSNELYGIYFAKTAIVKQDRCYLVEGYTDVISMHQVGIENVVASSGTSLTTGQIKLIHRFTNNITLLYDGDMAGIKASLRGIDMLLEDGLNIKVVLLPDGDDPDSFARKHNASSFQAYIQAHEVDFIRFKTNLLLQEAGTDPIKRASLIGDVVKSIAVIPSGIVRSVYVHECGELLQVDERLIVQEIQKIKRAKSTYKKQPEQTDQNAATTTASTPSAHKAASTQAEQKPSTEAIAAAQAMMNNHSATSKQQQIERDFVRIIIRYGEVVMAETQDGEAITVASYIASELQMDDLQFANPIYQQILTETLAHKHDDNFVANRYFLSHPDINIVEIAIQSSKDLYELSKYHSRTTTILPEVERLHELLPQLMGDYKYIIISGECQRIMQLIRTPNLGDEDYYMELLRQYNELSAIQKAMAKQQGERTITL